jgi:holliday junction DNA helicase RuvB
MKFTGKKATMENPKQKKQSGRQKIELPKAERSVLVSPQEGDVDGIVELSLRPKRISEFIGQAALKDNLAIALAAAKKRKEPLEHILFSGPPGLGKTTLAHVIAHEMGAKIVATSGPAIQRAGDLVSTLSNLEEGDILFVDEIHRLPRTVEEFVYPAMEDFKIDIPVTKGQGAKPINFPLKRFTLIGATTRSGLLSSPLRDRFGVAFHLDFYENIDLKEIINRSAKLLGVELDSAAAGEMALRSRGTPRIANRILRRVRDYAQVKATGKVTPQVVEQALSGHGIDAMGLDVLDRKVLKAIIEIYDKGPVGIESLAATLNEESDTLVDVVEPFLLKIGFLRRTSRGREATAAACTHLKLSAKRGTEDLFNAAK